jgi:hypothetical protein
LEPCPILQRSGSCENDALAQDHRRDAAFSYTYTNGSQYAIIGPQKKACFTSWEASSSFVLSSSVLPFPHRRTILIKGLLRLGTSVWKPMDLRPAIPTSHMAVSVPLDSTYTGLMKGNNAERTDLADRPVIRNEMSDLSVVWLRVTNAESMMKLPWRLVLVATSYISQL